MGWAYCHFFMTYLNCCTNHRYSTDWICTLPNETAFDPQDPNSFYCRVLLPTSSLSRLQGSRTQSWHSLSQGDNKWIAAGHIHLFPSFRGYKRTRGAWMPEYSCRRRHCRWQFLCNIVNWQWNWSWTYLPCKLMPFCFWLSNILRVSKGMYMPA